MHGDELMRLQGRQNCLLLVLASGMGKRQILPEGVLTRFRLVTLLVALLVMLFLSNL